MSRIDYLEHLLKFSIFPSLNSTVLSCPLHTHTLTYAHTHTDTHTYIYTHTHTHTYIHTYTLTYTHWHTHSHIQFTRSPFLNDDDRDDDEVITFEGNPSTNHSRGMPRHTLSDDFDSGRTRSSSEMVSTGKKSL